MANIRRFLGLSAFVALASCLPAADPNDDDFACWTSKDQYRSSSGQYEGSYFEEFVTTWSHISTTTITDVAITTLCDGKPRLLEPYKTITVTSIETLESPTPTIFQLPYTEPSPTCTIAESACTAIIYSHHLDLKFCTTTRTDTIIPCTSDASQSCELYDAGQSTLYYWPQTTTDGDFCKQNGSTIFAPHPDTHPNTAVVDGVTFTSPTAYMSFDNIRAERFSKVGFREKVGQCGGPATEHVVFPITEPLYSADGNYNGLGDQTWSFNFADMNTVPAEAYSRQWKCSDRWNPEYCTGIMAPQAEYTPWVVIPTDLANLKPEEWKAAGCVGPKVAADMYMVALPTPAPTEVNKML